MPDRAALYTELQLAEYDAWRTASPPDLAAMQAHASAKTVQRVEEVDPFDLWKHVPLAERELLRIRYPSVYEEIQALIGQSRGLDIGTARIQALFATLQADSGAHGGGGNTFDASTVTNITNQATKTIPLSESMDYGQRFTQRDIEKALLYGAQ